MFAPKDKYLSKEILVLAVPVTIGNLSRVFSAVGRLVSLYYLFCFHYNVENKERWVERDWSM